MFTLFFRVSVINQNTPCAIFIMFFLTTFVEKGKDSGTNVETQKGDDFTVSSIMGHSKAKAEQLYFQRFLCKHPNISYFLTVNLENFTRSRYDSYSLGINYPWWV